MVLTGHSSSGSSSAKLEIVNARVAGSGQYGT